MIGGFMRRGKLEILIALLEVCEEEVLKTTLVYKTNLNFKIVRDYLKFLKEKGWVMENGKMYRITDAGKTFLKKAKEIYSEF